MTGIDINKKLESFSNLINEFGVSNFNSREIWNRKKEIDENFRAAQFDSAELKTETVNKFNALIALLEQKEKDAANVNEQFTVDTERAVANFFNNAQKVLTKDAVNKDDFKLLRDDSNKIFDLFKQQRFSTKERRTTAWDKYNEIRNSVKDKEDELFAAERATKAKQISQSLEITEKICVVIDACHPSVMVDELKNLVVRFNDFLKENNLAEQNKTWFLIEKPEEIKYSLRCRAETLNDVRTFVNNYKDYLLREHKGQIFSSIDNLKDDLNKAWETHKEERQKQQEEWEIKKKERDEKRIEWNKKQQEFLVFLEKRLENQIAYKAKQEGYLQSQREYAKRFENRIPAQQEYIKKLVDQIIDLEKKHATAWTDSFKTKVEEWIAEKKEKIASVEADIETLKEKVADINKNIDELPKKVEELDASIIEIQSKIVEVKEKLANDNITEPTANKVIDENKETLVEQESAIEVGDEN